MMETNNKKCPFCYSKLKKDELNCPKCREKIFTKDTIIIGFPWSIILKKIRLPFGIIALFWVFECFMFVLINFRVVFTHIGFLSLKLIFFINALIFYTLIPVSFIIIMGYAYIIMAFISFKIIESHFIISSEKIQVKTRHNHKISNNVVIEVLWKEINKIEIIKERYIERKFSTDGEDTIESGYKLKFYLSEKEKSFRLACLNFRNKKVKEKIANLIKSFSEHLKKEIDELEDLEEVISWKDICPKEKISSMPKVFL